MLDLYEPDAVMAFPPGQLTIGHAAIRALFEQMVAARPAFQPEDPLQTLVVGDIALTATRARDEAGARAQVARRQPDGTWKRVAGPPRLPRLIDGGRWLASTHSAAFPVHASR